MYLEKFRGIYAIAPVPFDDGYAVDYAALDRVVEFIVAGGAHGLVVNVNASEFNTLSDRERTTIVEAAARRNGGRLPLVVGVTAQDGRLSAEFAAHAQAAGADGVIAMPPHTGRQREEGILRYYEAIDRAVTIPIFLQNAEPPLGTPMSAPFLRRLLAEFAQVQYLKEETAGYTALYEALNQLDGVADALRGTMGGKGCLNLMEEHARGFCGNMPACEVADVLAQLWNLMDAGRLSDARVVYRAALPLLQFESIYLGACWKGVLRQRGVITCAKTRTAEPPLDAPAEEQLTLMLDELRPFFRADAMAWR